MTTIKSYTDLEQSKKLVEFLPIESADMAYYFMKDSGHLVNPSPFVLDGTEVREDGMFTYLDCWSLTALLDVLPSGYVIVKNYHSFYYVESRGHERSTNIFNNPIDACVAMIEKLHELNLL